MNNEEENEETIGEALRALINKGLVDIVVLEDGDIGFIPTQAGIAESKRLKAQE